MTIAPIRTIVRWIARRALRWYYREVEFVGREHVPSDGPVLLFGNHPNDLPDVFCGYFTTERPVRYVGTISTGISWIARTTYKGMGVIPVTRARDARKMKAQGVDIAEVNRRAFGQVHDAFERGQVVGIFPEGRVHAGPKVASPRSGVAIMALNAIDSVAIEELIAVPFGVQYDAAATLRSDAIVVVGHRVSLADWRLQTANAVPATLAAELHGALLTVTRNSENTEDADLRDRLAAGVAAVHATTAETLLKSTANVQHFCGELISGTGPHVEAINSDVVHWRTTAVALGSWVERAGGIKHSARDTARMLDACGLPNPQAQWPTLLWLTASALPAWIGLLVHWPLFFAVRRVAAKMSEDQSDLAARAILPGLYLILSGYLLLGVAFALGFRAASISAWWALPAVVILPRLGDLSLMWHDAHQALRLRWRVRHWPESYQVAVRTGAEQVRNAWAEVAAKAFRPNL